MSNLFLNIKEVLCSNGCLVGMGNYLKSDDAVGLYIVESVKKAVRDSYPIMNVEDVIEAYVFKISEMDCDNIVVVDAVKTGAETGSIVFGKLEEDIEGLNGSLSTHKLALEVSGKIFREHGKNTYLLGVVVDNVDFGSSLSRAVRESADVLIDVITDALK